MSGFCIAGIANRLVLRRKSTDDIRLTSISSAELDPIGVTRETHGGSFPMSNVSRFLPFFEFSPFTSLRQRAKHDGENLNWIKQRPDGSVKRFRRNAMLLAHTSIE